MTLPFQAIEQWIASGFAEQTRFLQQVVQVPTDTPPGDNAASANNITALLKQLGLEVEQHSVPAQQVQAYGMRSITNLIVRHRFSADGPTIALNAHGDVVPPGEGWTHDPYGGQIVDGKMFARGVAVSKSDIASYTWCLLALKQAHQQGWLKLHGAIELHFTFDEEFGGLLGPGWLLAQGLTRPDYVIAASFSYQVVVAHNACLQLEVTVHGKAAHGSMPHTGVDAFQAGVGILNALYGLIPGLGQIQSKVAGINSPTMVVGLIQGGINTNVVPDKLSFKFDRRLIPEENPLEVEQQLHSLIQTTAARYPGVRVDIKRLLLANAMVPSAAQAPLVGAIQSHAQRVFGEVPPAVGVPLYTDARLYSEAGIPIVLYGAGPRTVLESNAKRADENLVLDDLLKATQVVACAVGQLLSNPPKTQTA
jgi:succinyl-diaminopimelate desuccinylase